MSPFCFLKIAFTFRFYFVVFAATEFRSNELLRFEKLDYGFLDDVYYSTSPVVSLGCEKARVVMQSKERKRGRKCFILRISRSKV